MLQFVEGCMGATSLNGTEFSRYKELIGDDCTEPSWSIKLPGLPLLKIRDLPSFLQPFKHL
ncbi:putative crocetin glucosyltransferase [Helianthus anomalus]